MASIFSCLANWIQNAPQSEERRSGWHRSRAKAMSGAYVEGDRRRVGWSYHESAELQSKALGLLPSDRRPQAPFWLRFVTESRVNEPKSWLDIWSVNFDLNKT